MVFLYFPLSHLFLPAQEIPEKLNPSQVLLG